jgi:hypothetical protein
MNVTLVNLSNELFNTSRNRLNLSAKNIGIKQINSYNFEDLRETEFFSNNQEILAYPKGMGYWLWKPYIILESLNKLKEDDILVYSDCGIELLHDIHPIIELTNNQSIILFGNANHQNYMWTKRDCFILMDCDTEEYWYSSHVDAAFIVLKKNDFVVNFVNEWLKFGKKKNIITDLPNVTLENLNGFIEHRWDQSILSILAQKHKLNLYRMPTQFGNHYKTHDFRIKGEFNCVNQAERTEINYYATIPYYNSPYLQLLNHHRFKDAQALSEDLYLLDTKVYKNQTAINFLKKLANRLLSYFGIKIIRI